MFRAIFNSQADPNANVSQPCLQCVQVKPLAGQQGAPERFRVVFSDINNFVQSMLATRESLTLIRRLEGTYLVWLRGEPCRS